MMRTFQFEHYWFVGMLAGLVVVPWGVVLATVPHPLEVYREVGWRPLAVSNLFAVGWGIANVLYGVCVVRIGAALTGAILSGLGVVAGVTMPMVLKGSGKFQDAPDLTSAAGAIDEFLMGRKRLGRWVRIEEAGDTGRLRDHDLYTPAPMRTLPLERRRGHEEVDLGLGAEEIEINARRCYLCNYKFEIDQDKCIHCDWCIKVSPRACIHQLTCLFTDEDGAPTGHVPSATASDATYIWIDSHQCIRCGNCHRACPTYAIPVRKADMVYGPLQ